MPTYTVTIPEEKQLFFEELLASMGFDSQREDFELDDETKKMLDQRLDAYYKEPKDVIDFDKALEEIENEL